MHTAWSHDMIPTDVSLTLILCFSVLSLSNLLLVSHVTGCGTTTIVATTGLEKHELYTRSTSHCSLCQLIGVKRGFVLATCDVLVSRWATTKTCGVTTQYFSSTNVLPSTGLLIYWLYPILLIPVFANKRFQFLWWWFICFNRTF